jgi:DNA-nicking Smr family endonuclease
MFIRLPYNAFENNMAHKDLSDEDKKAFAEAMEKVTPLKASKRATHRPTKKLTEQHQQQRIRATRQQQQRQSYDYGLSNTDHWVDAEAKVSYRLSGLNPKTWRRLQAGNVSIEAKLDLHHQTAAESHTLVDEFIAACRQRGLRFVLIIHGKGRDPHTKPILKNLVNQWLRERNDILAFHTAKPKHGGGGALYVLLKSTM